MNEELEERIKKLEERLNLLFNLQNKTVEAIEILNETHKTQQSSIKQLTEIVQEMFKLIKKERKKYEERISYIG